ncbi:MAG: S-methyl-5-thioribose-1-phosphate isomerase [Bacteroidales bacterium]
MKIYGEPYQTIWQLDETTIQVIDQRVLPFRFKIFDLKTAKDVHHAIHDMVVRGAPLIGVAASYGMYLAMVHAKNNDNWKEELRNAGNYLKSARPTAVNLAYAVDQQLYKLVGTDDYEQAKNLSLEVANNLRTKEIENCRLIGEHGFPLIEKIARKKQGKPVNILTHCNAGWLACIDYGTATAPIYNAYDKGIKVHVWVDETRPRNQGARLTAWELQQHGVPHTVIPDNTGGLLMQKGMVDMVIVGSDRTSARGDVANKIGTYLKALAAKENNLPFYVALPLSSIDRNIYDGVNEIPIEQRSENEIRYIEGYDEGQIRKVRITPAKSPVANYGFDVTPADYVKALITEKGLCKPDETEIKKLFGDEGK